MCIKMEINKKKIIALNKKFGGSVINESGLDFAIEMANREKNLFKSNAYIIRGIILDHPFLDGNKRTATTIIARRFAEHNIACDEKKLVKSIVNIAKKNIHSIMKISKKLRKCCKKIKNK